MQVQVLDIDEQLCPTERSTVLLGVHLHGGSSTSPGQSPHGPRRGISLDLRWRWRRASMAGYRKVAMVAAKAREGVDW